MGSDDGAVQGAWPSFGFLYQPVTRTGRCKMSDPVKFSETGVDATRICHDCGSVLSEIGNHTAAWVKSFKVGVLQKRSRLYRIWSCMKTRCTNPKNNSYKYYGARGFCLCDEWQDFAVFRAWALSHGYEPGLKIDRADNDQGYFPENCRFATDQEQMQNRRLPTRKRTGKRYNRRTLVAEDVYAIRDSELSDTVLGGIYDLHHTTISKIRSRKSWANLPERV